MMRKTLLAVGVLLVVSVVAVVVVAQQDKSKRPSPPANAKCQFADGKTINVDYSSPRTKGRKIYGGLVPYGQEWRTGANEATTFDTTANVEIAGTAIPAGHYTLFTVPAEGTWKLVISKKTGEWGIPYPGKQFDLARVDMKTQALPTNVENFTISFQKADPRSCVMNIDWEKTRAYVDISEKK
jgi:ABC-type phosphate transport system substrate-binding protein